MIRTLLISAKPLPSTGLESVSIRRIQGVGYNVLEFLGKLRVAVLMSKEAIHLLHYKHMDITLPEDFKAAGFSISADDAGTIIEGHNPEKLKSHGGVDGLATKLKTCTTNGLAMDDKELATRQELYGTIDFIEQGWPKRSHDGLEIMFRLLEILVKQQKNILEGWPKRSHDGLGIGGYVTSKRDWLSAYWTGFKSPEQVLRIRNTGVKPEILKNVGKTIATLPETFKPHRVVKKFFSLGDDDHWLESGNHFFDKWTSPRLTLIEEKQATIRSIKSLDERIYS
ncbi:hypothetical protein Tco_0009851 [Tanacetum coccineum]